MFCGEVHLYTGGPGYSYAAADGAEPNADAVDEDSSTVLVYVPSTDWTGHEHHAAAHHQTGLSCYSFILD